MSGRVKKSYGLLCFRRNKHLSHEIVMIKKSVTYHFCGFVFGHYKKDNDYTLLKLFNNMTYHEKIDILNLNFENLWYRIYKKKPDELQMQSYLRKEIKFKQTFLHNNRLKRLMAASTNVDTPWEFPKGHKDEQKKEFDMDTAIREFTEETGINRDKIKVLWNMTPYVETYTDFGVTYQNIYYFAEAIGDWEPELRFYDKQQISEVCDVKWISKENLKHIKLEKVTYKRLLKSFDKIIKKYSNYR